MAINACHGGVTSQTDVPPLLPCHAMPYRLCLSPKIGTESEKETLAGGAGEVTSEVLMQHPLGRLTLLACLYRLLLCTS
jgi:hypothetical protein